MACAFGGDDDVPELPEVETTRRGLKSVLLGRTVSKVKIRNARLRQTVPRQLGRRLNGQQLVHIRRRAKYLLFEFTHGTLIAHLGMSGSLRIVRAGTAFRKHDHVEIVFDAEHALRLHDPRRFGLILWTRDAPEAHPLLQHLGPEPWHSTFNAAYLYALSRGRKVAVKKFLMDGKVVVGVGNIYASEALHRAGVHPQRAAGRIGQQRYKRIIIAVQAVLDEAIAVGGTTLRDFLHSDGEPGYFRLQLRVYGRAGQRCACRAGVIQNRLIGQRSSFYCPRCQH